MDVKGYWHLSIRGPHPEGGTIVYHPSIGEVRVSRYTYRSDRDVWDLLPWIDEPDVTQVV